ncbi:hypothetical protein QFW77_07470 [Luteimonas sp. RD2P54]|uniref:Uncharacterized protein n=1 Tax=Luteimonas endophytica TaxID=3042023 RepID=A0ABT6J9F3_9GAMM|nr:hypothetical protein [Luteimonas endophytica]MDH5822833.1 hypothetical protein [Luteimonas endophytica]
MLCHRVPALNCADPPGTGGDRAGAGAPVSSAAVVGVILNLSLWFAIHVLFAEVGRWEGWGLDLPMPVLSSLDIAALALGALAMLALLRFGIGLPRTPAICALLGLLAQAAGIG